MAILHPFPEDLRNSDLNKNINDYTEYFQAVHDAKIHFYETGEMNDIVRKEVADSWREDKANGHSPNAELPIPSPDAAALQKLLTDNRYLIKVGSEVIDTICRTLNKIDFSLQLYDSHSNLLYVNNKFEDNITWEPPSQVQIGLDFSSDIATTTTTKLARKYGHDFSLYGPEHYYLTYENICCCTTLIHGSNDDLVGMLNIAYSIDNMNTLLPGIAKLAGNLIGQRIRQHTYHNIIDLTFDDVSEGAIVADANKNIVMANKSFLRMLNIEDLDICGKDIRTIFKEADFDQLVPNSNEKIHLSETMVDYGKKSYRMKIDISLLTYYGHSDGYLILCREIQNIIALSQRYTSSAITNFDNIITQDYKMQQIINSCRKIALSKIPVLLEGASGTGKDLFAQAIHNASPRNDKPFIAVNCAALPMDLVESELFGYEKGSFTGALATGKAGKFEQADGGTIFLDEIGELPLGIQAKLLRVLDNHKITRIGGKHEIDLDIRIISATNRDLDEEIKLKNFREDLYYRLNVMNFHIPPLAERGNDIILIAESFLKSFNASNNTNRYFTHEARQKMLRYTWKGNVRELQNSVMRAYYLCEAEQLEKIDHDKIMTREDKPMMQNAAASDNIPTSTASLKDRERQAISDALSRYHNVKDAASALDMPLSTMYKRIKQYGLK